MAIVAQLSLNRLGRDFVVGDIHGCFGLVDEAMRIAGFDPVRDRLLSLGDLIDRGDQSPRALEFLGMPWFHAILGNHEAMVLDLYEDGPPKPKDLDLASRRNGFEWWLDLGEAQRKAFVERFRTLPHALEVETRRGAAGLVHADVADGLGWGAFVQRLRDGDPWVAEEALWGRNRLDREDRSGVRGIERVFVGHTPIDDPIRLGNVLAIDTGAVFGMLDNNPASGRLMMVEIGLEIEALAAPAAHLRFTDVRV